MASGAARVLEELRSVLVGWCRDVCCTHGNWPATDTITAMAARLVAHDWGQHPAVDEAADEVHWITGRATAAIDTTEPKVFLGPCDLTATGGCRREVWAARAAINVLCPACGATIDVAERQAQLLDASNGILAHAELIGRALTSLATPLQPATIRKWASRGRLLPRGHDSQGRALYLVGECRDLVNQAATRGRRPVGAAR